MFKQCNNPNQQRYTLKPNESCFNKDQPKSSHNSNSNLNKTTASSQSVNLSGIQRSNTHLTSSNITDSSSENQFIVGETPLIVAVYYKKYDIIRLLLKAPNLQLNLCDSHGWSALHYAVYNKSEELVLLLLKKKCNRNICDNYNKKPIHIAQERGYIEIAAILEADPLYVHIHDMCEVGNIQLVKALIKQGRGYFI